MTRHQITALAAQIRLVITDVDGVLTDGGVYYGQSGEVMKRFNIRDGMGAVRLRDHGVETVIITGENSPSVARRAEKLGLHYILGCNDKVAALRDLSARLDVPLENIAYIGDDVNDLDAMQLTGLPAAPRDAFHTVLEIAAYVCRRPGGHGAFRELAELIIDAKEQSEPGTAMFGFR